MEIENNKPDIISSDAVSVETYSRASYSLTKFGACVRSISLYGRFHPMFRESVVAAHQALVEMLVVQPTLIVAVTDSYLALDSFPIEDSADCLSAFARLLRERKVGELKLSAGVSEEEIAEFAEVMSLTPEELALRGGVRAELRKRNVTNIAVSGNVFITESREGRDPADIYEEALILIEEAMKAVQAGLRIPVPEIRSVVADSLRSLTNDENILLALAGIRSYDRYLAEHSVNVCLISMILGRDLGLDTSSTLELGISAMLHDVGKVFIPAEVVRKPTRLSEEEWVQVRRHPAAGARALAGLSDLPALASTIALEHHVYCDGSGYPAFPPGQKPHLLSRLIAIVDTYDALTTDRPYRERWSGQQAIAWMIYESHGRYDRQLIARFASRAKLYPPGSIVRLVGGDFAVVVGGSSKHPTRPVLKILAPPGKSGVPGDIVDLSKNTSPELEIAALAQPVEILLPYTDELIAA